MGKVEEWLASIQNPTEAKSPLISCSAALDFGAEENPSSKCPGIESPRSRRRRHCLSCCDVRDPSLRFNSNPRMECLERLRDVSFISPPTSVKFNALDLSKWPSNEIKLHGEIYGRILLHRDQDNIGPRELHLSTPGGEPWHKNGGNDVHGIPDRRTYLERTLSDIPGRRAYLLRTLLALEAWEVTGVTIYVDGSVAEFMCMGLGRDDPPDFLWPCEVRSMLPPD